MSADLSSVCCILRAHIDCGPGQRGLLCFTKVLSASLFRSVPSVPVRGNILRKQHPTKPFQAVA